MKRTLSSILALLMLLSTVLVASCGEGSQNEDDTTAVAATETPGDPTEPAETELQSKVLPDGLNFNNEEVIIISRDSVNVSDEIYAESLTGDVFNDAIFRRNSNVEKRLNVRITNQFVSGDNYAVSERLRNAASTGDKSFDIAANSTYSTIMYTGEGILRDLNDCEYLDLSAPYWSAGFNQSASIGSAQYLATGAIAITLFRYMFVNFFNINLISRVNRESLFDVAEDGRWTLDYLMQLTEDMYDDANGDGIINKGDTVGFVSNTEVYVDPYWSSCDNRILRKTEDNWLVYDLDVNRLSDTLGKVITLYFQKHALIFEDTNDNSIQDNLIDIFSSGKAANVTLRLVAVETEPFRTMTDEYGIIPVPKLDEAQEKYHTFIHDQFTSFGINAMIGDDARFQMLGAVLEAMALESYKIVVPEYYNTALKGKYLRNSQSWIWLDRIYESIQIDPGVLYTKSLNSVHQSPRTIVKGRNNTTVSTYKGMSILVPKLLETFQNKIMEMQDK